MATTEEDGQRSSHRNYAHLLHPMKLRHMVRCWLEEDTPSFDYGGFVVGEQEECALLLCKSEGVVAGAPFVDAIFKELDCTVEWLVKEGVWLKPVTTVAKVRGKVRHLLLGERVALNCLSRASGIASKAHRLNSLKISSGWPGCVAGTRKTTPGFRLVEKYALLVGGLDTHRFDLSSMIMLKDNHIWTAGNITKAVQDARQVGGFSLKIEVECRSLEEAMEAAAAGADVVMLDNFSPQAAQKAAAGLKASYPGVLTEASGGINEAKIVSYMLPNINIISLSEATQGQAAVDFSFKIVKTGRDPSNPEVL